MVPGNNNEKAEENPNSTSGTAFTVKLPIYNFLNEERP